MPLYEYVCGNCHSRFEKLVARFGDDVFCPSCASGTVERQLSAFAVGSSTPSSEGCGAGVCDAASCSSAEGGPGPCGGGACGFPR
jgi:putative FmdB family regulatory protein